MAQPASLPSFATLAEFLDWEAQQPEKYEFYDGRVHLREVGMAGAGGNHTAITPVLSGMCRNLLRGSNCRYFDQDTKVLAAELGFYADGGIACPPNHVSFSKGTIDNPTVLFEVLSPGTEKVDRTRKFDAYATLASLKDYVLVASDAKRVEVFSRQTDGSWALRVFIGGATAHLPSVDLDLPLDELYEDAVFEAADAYTG